MGLSAPRAWLVAYDIADPQRLSRFHRFIQRNAVPVQHSVFYYEGSAAQVGRLVREMERRIDKRMDDVRVYQLPATLDCVVLGKGSLPEPGCLVSGLGIGLAALTGPTGG